MARGHDLSKMHLICRDHHRLVHRGWIESHDAPPGEWRTQTTPGRGPAASGRREAVDRKYHDHLQAAARRDGELDTMPAAEDDGAPAEDAPKTPVGDR